MNHQCPNCGREYDAELNYCRKCGEPSKASPRSSATEPADKRNAADGSSSPNVTTHINEFFPKNPRQVEPRPEAEGDDARASEGSPCQEAKDPKSASAKQGRANAKTKPTRAPESLTAEAVHYRSVRMLSRAVIVGNVSTTIAVIGLALIFTLSNQRMLKGMQDTIVTSADKVSEIWKAQVDGANARAEKSDAENAQLKQANVKLEQANVTLQRAYAANEDSLRRANDKMADVLLARMSPTLTRGEIKTGASALATISLKVKDRDAKRAIEKVRQKYLANEGRREIYNEYAQLLPKLDEKTRAEVEDKVGKPLIGD